MTDYKFLSRKFLISVMLLVISTLFLANKTVTQYQWQMVFMATIITYLGSKTLEKVKAKNVDMPVSFWKRIIGMMSREFVLALCALITATIFAYTKTINGDIWFQIATSIGSMYNIFNAVSKTE